jgi:hypothetical protein
LRSFKPKDKYEVDELGDYARADLQEDAQDDQKGYC